MTGSFSFFFLVLTTSLPAMLLQWPAWEAVIDHPAI